MAVVETKESSQPLNDPKPVNKLWSVCLFILGVEACERLCFYTLQASMRPFLQKTGLRNTNATSITGCFGTLYYAWCFIGGYVADNVTGKYGCILYLGALYVVGAWLVAIAALPQVTNFLIYFIGAFVFVCIGGGMIKPNVMNFGADQYNESIEEERQQQQSFFSYFYWTIQLGAMVALGFIGSIATADGGVSCEGTCWGFFKSYLIAACAMTMAFLIYVSGSGRYQAKERPEHKPVFRILAGCIAASRMCFQKALALIGWFLLPTCLPILIIGSLIPDLSVVFGWISFVMALVGVVALCLAHTKNGWIQSYSDMPTGPDIIELQDVKQFFAIVPVMLTVSVGFGVAYNSMNTGYPTMACFMDHPRFVNGQMTAIGDTISILLLSPILEPIFVRNKVSTHTKFVWGFIFVILANLSASALEYVRAGSGFTDKVSNCALRGVYMSNMSFLWTLIPMGLTGIGEILINPVIYGLVYQNAPIKLRSLAQGFNLAANGAIAGALTTSLTNIYVPSNFNYWTNSSVDGWTTDAGNPQTHSILCEDGECGTRGHVQTYFFLSCGLSVLALLSYLAVWYGGEARHIRNEHSPSV